MEAACAAAVASQVVAATAVAAVAVDIVVNKETANVAGGMACAGFPPTLQIIPIQN